jgi:DNA-directed RNA polymerase specialized sigma24 family protein
MAIYSKLPTESPSDVGFDITWNELCPKLRLLVRRFVYSFHVQSWRGQEDDIIEDILQETARRIIERQQKAENGEASPIQMFERMAIAIAGNYCKDMRRRDCRLVRLPEGARSPKVLEIISERDVVDLSEEATEHLYQERLFGLLAREIVKFPHKQRQALLIDLANRMSFEAKPTLLQKAFLNVGICLKEYRQPLLDSANERSKSAALLYYAYKRIAHLVCVQQIVAFA